MSPHDSTGANLIVQVKANQVMRVVPLENEAVNECWIADRDRFSYEALNGEQRLRAPMLKQGGQWISVDWTTALEYVANGLQQVRADHGAAAIGALASPHSTVEELHLLAKLVRGLGSENIDHRLRHAGAEPTKQVRWLGTSIASLSTLDRALVIGSFLRKDHPLFAQRLRQATRRGAQVTALNALADDWLLPVAARISAAPSGWVGALASIAAAVALAKSVAAPVEATATVEAKAIAASLLTGQHKALLLGNAAAAHPQAESLLALANWIAGQVGATCGYLGEAANSVGAQLVNAQPGVAGLSAAQMLGDQPRKAVLLFNTEAVLDAADPQAARAALDRAQMVVSFSPFADANLDVADVLLPIAPFSETSGSFVNAEGRVQSFHGVVKPLAETRPAWKVLRVLGTMLGLANFGFDSSDEVKAAALGDLSQLPQRLANVAGADAVAVEQGAATLERIADVPIYSTDSLVRRAAALQHAADAAPPVAWLPTALWQQLGLQSGDKVRVSQGSGSVMLPARLDATLAANAVRVPAGHAATTALGALFGAITVEQA